LKSKTIKFYRKETKYDFETIHGSWRYIASNNVWNNFACNRLVV